MKTEYLKKEIRVDQVQDAQLAIAQLGRLPELADYQSLGYNVEFDNGICLICFTILHKDKGADKTYFAKQLTKRAFNRANELLSSFAKNFNEKRDAGNACAIAQKPEDK